MNTWIAAKDLMKHYCLAKRIFIAVWTWNSVLGKTMENVRKHRGINIVTTDKRRNQLVSEPNCYTEKCFSEDLLATEMKKTKVKMNTPVYLGL